MNKYHPISCSLYNHLEIFALRKKDVGMGLKNDNHTGGFVYINLCIKNLSYFLSRLGIKFKHSNSCGSIL